MQAYLTTTNAAATYQPIGTIRGAIYNSTTTGFITITPNTVYSHEFQFENFNVSPNTIVNVTFSEYTTIQDGSTITPQEVPIWQVIDITPVQDSTTGKITIKFVGIVMTPSTQTLGLQSLNIMIMNPQNIYKLINFNIL